VKQNPWKHLSRQGGIHCKVNEQDINSLRHLCSNELIQRLNIPFYKIPSVILKLRKQMRHDIPSLPSFNHLPDVIQQLHDKNIQLGILTSNATENVTAWLDNHKMRHLFQFIHSEKNYFGKKRVLNKILRSHQISKSTTAYVGDETRDIEAANACGITSIAVTWGFNTEAVLSLQKPHHLIRTPQDLLRIPA
jgi:phosphoglycolate phosphatase-like HAD superfamily hydrolase